MYSKFENPIIKASIYYYDDTYNEIVPTKVLSVLKKYGMFPPQKINADNMTRYRYLKANENTEALFVKAYGEKMFLVWIWQAETDGMIANFGDLHGILLSIRIVILIFLM